MEVQSCYSEKSDIAFGDCHAEIVSVSDVDMIYSVIYKYYQIQQRKSLLKIRFVYTVGNGGVQNLLNVLNLLKSKT